MVMSDDKKTFKFNILTAGERCEPVRQAINDLADEYGWPALETEFCLAAEEATRKEAGRPGLSKDKIMHVWIAIEIKRYLSEKGIDATVKEVLQKLHGKPWLVFVGNKREYEMKKTARRWHTTGNALMKGDPKLAKRWTHSLDVAKKIIDEKWSAKLIEGQLNTYRDGVLIRSIPVKKERGPKVAPGGGVS
jgi:hypothetical protein